MITLMEALRGVREEKRDEVKLLLEESFVLTMNNKIIIARVVR